MKLLLKRKPLQNCAASAKKVRKLVLVPKPAAKLRDTSQELASTQTELVSKVKKDLVYQLQVKPRLANNTAEKSKVILDF
jgi:hypothetical protein